MKKLLVSTLLVASTSVFALDVTKYFSISFNGNTEASVIEQAEDAIPGVVNATIKRVKRDLNFEQCWPLKSRYIKIEGLSVSKQRKYVDGKFRTSYLGRLGYSHSNCFEPGDS
ncbi:MAG: hypothetical protein HOO06_13570 [Bdellovibrionaceae bacterium]|jgi:hypothetical protein|nr:hypothetical protein [Pseudobdellovibrionaceae bacterium]